MQELPVNMLPIDQFFQSDALFHRLYPKELHKQAGMHWTPLAITQKAAAFLAAVPGARILDIGSGAGKFCLAAAYYQPNAFYTGVEQRAALVSYAIDAAKKLQMNQVSFINANIDQVDFGVYDHFYFFNAFHENIAEDYRIDEQVVYSEDLYHRYHRYVYRQLEKKPAGTRLVSFHSAEPEIPATYHVVGTDENELLKYWIKI
jgi:predicted RNA methylase